MGGRVASMIADDMFALRKTDGLLCLSYPFLPIRKPDQLPTANDVEMRPLLLSYRAHAIYLAREEAAGYKLPKAIEIFWFEDGDHDLNPRKAVSGFAAAGHRLSMANHVAT
jgi:predicted alpha/beta-hydrolase family hydrolase